MNIVMLANDTTFAYNLRREIIEELIKNGHSVTFVGEILGFEDEIKNIGARIINVTTSRRGTNVLQDICLFLRYYKIFSQIKPDLVLTNNIKPNSYGGLASRLLRIRFIPNITGLGTAVENPGKLQLLATYLYKLGTYGAICIFFQNQENINFFQQRNMISPRTRVCLLPGSGVNLKFHNAISYPDDKIVHFLYIARIMKEKGIDIYLSAAKAIHEKYPDTMFHVCGMCDDPNYIDILKQAEIENYVQYHGQQKNMEPFFAMASCIVHPSYYPEGMSNVLLEAAASARPIIATDRAGCRETVDDGVSGFVIPVKSTEALIASIDKFMHMSWKQRRDMGLAGRRKMEREFDRKLVVKAYMKQINSVEREIM